MKTRCPSNTIEDFLDTEQKIVTQPRPTAIVPRFGLG